jgi:hypothetical protein
MVLDLHLRYKDGFVEPIAIKRCIYQIYLHQEIIYNGY